ncbi:MAG: heat-inducible transcription repressor HrcA [Chloroflexi bacterium]|nr:heat-inducible transcription repressor HrcA [Chloroflexota bacterium]
MALTERQHQVLRIIVGEYIHSPVPVSSEGVAHKMPAPVSSATIRNEMAVLEEEGYVARRHTSGGGVPSDKAYRAYVESLGDALEPSRRVKEQVRRNFQTASLDVEARNRSAVRLLAELERAMAVATMPTSEEARWKHLDLVHLQGLLALLIMVIEGSGHLKQQHVLLREPMSQDQLTQLSNKLNAKMAGLGTDQVLARSGGFAGVEQDFISLAASFMREEEQQSIPDYFVDGLRHMFAYPELAEGTQARAIAEILEYQGLVKALLGNVPEQGVVRVTIGAEHKEDLLRPFTVVFTRYGTPSGGRGVVGVMGPTRFEYASAISNVRYLASVMGNMAAAV